MLYNVYLYFVSESREKGNIVSLMFISIEYIYIYFCTLVVLLFIGVNYIQFNDILSSIELNSSIDM